LTVAMSMRVPKASKQIACILKGKSGTIGSVLRVAHIVNSKGRNEVKNQLIYGNSSSRGSNS